MNLANNSQQQQQQPQQPSWGQQLQQQQQQFMGFQQNDQNHLAQSQPPSGNNKAGKLNHNLSQSATLLQQQSIYVTILTLRLWQ